MNVGIVGSSPLAAVVAHRLLKAFRVHVLAPEWPAEHLQREIVPVQDLAALSQQCRVLLVCAASAALHDTAGFGARLPSGTTVVDLSSGDPADAKALAAALQQRGIGFVDAPLHCESHAALPEASAITCGGPAGAVAAVRPLLEAICPKVIDFGDAGNGRAAALVVATVAAANRLVTYETAAMGFCNGLSVEDMGTVLTRCSGNNSGTVRLLPAIAAGRTTADVPLRSVVADLTLASQLAAKVGAPMMIGNLVRSLLQAESNRLGSAAALDDTFSRFHDATRQSADRAQAVA
ncbi:MAG TPA: NAD(P)-binding domain-containing protein [Ideonella sp.]|uniref:NAD(P)-binding domain-containing protein n=1 Tax=Ideonella sp. TaxID=1929293 RepID=UPI002C341148|nr:NAD(P)-binding domain-containing protein [Ideonella sp.]HSI47110.1 NAD(P)-binding domain-containing protein [Ideonella sp.]